MARTTTGRTRYGLRERIYRIMFEADTSTGRGFDILLILAIVASVVAVMLDSMATVREAAGGVLSAAEWAFTILFTIEYLLRLYAAPRRIRYARSFFGVIDLLALAPTYLSILLPGGHFLLVVRVLRVLRVFRVFKLAKYVAEAELIVAALKASGRKIAVFLFAVLSIVVVVGSLIYLIEGDASGFTSIPRSVYWAIVTLTTVGYGDISPRTPLGQTLAAAIMILGYGLIAVPTGLVSMEISLALSRHQKRVCPECGTAESDPDAKFCRRCSAGLV
jgi:voltage-gated potassium channel